MRLNFGPIKLDFLESYGGFVDVVAWALYGVNTPSYIF